MKAIMQILSGSIHLHTSTVEDAIQRTVRGGRRRTIMAINRCCSLVESFCWARIA